jgi:hypothetical protein
MGKLLDTQLGDRASAIDKYESALDVLITEAVDSQGPNAGVEYTRSYLRQRHDLWVGKGRLRGVMSRLFSQQASNGAARRRDKGGSEGETERRCDEANVNVACGQLDKAFAIQAVLQIR